MPRIALDIPPGLNGDDTTFAAAGRWADASNVRFWLGRAQVVGGWEMATGDMLTGVCRSAFQWTDNNAVLNVSFGTHTKLQVMFDGSVFDITPTSGFTAGAPDGTGGAGYSTGTYSTGDYSEPSTADFFPMTWSLSAWGENLIGNPRGQPIFIWTNNTGTPAAEIVNAPDNVTYALVAPQDQIFALGCNEETSGDFNPLCIRHSGVRNKDQWTTSATTTAREYILPGGGRIVAGRVIGRQLLVWTNSALFLGTYVGQPGQVWRFDRVGDKCGLLGPNAAVVVGQVAYWVGSDLQFRRYALGGQAEILPCPIRNAFADNLAASQGDKVVASSISKFAEVRFDYPDARDGNENSRYLSLSLTDGAWSRGIMDRTTFIDAGPSEFPIGVSASGAVYWHERGRSADGAPFAWFIKTADQYLSEDQNMMVRGIWPDIADQVGPVNATLTYRLKPQGDERTSGPHAMAPGDDKVDVRANGRLFNVTYSGESAPTYARFGRQTFDVVGTSGR